MDEVNTWIIRPSTPAGPDRVRVTSKVEDAGPPAKLSTASAFDAGAVGAITEEVDFFEEEEGEAVDEIEGPLFGRRASAWASALKLLERERESKKRDRSRKRWIECVHEYIYLSEWVSEWVSKCGLNDFLGNVVFSLTVYSPLPMVFVFSHLRVLLHFAEKAEIHGIWGGSHSFAHQLQLLNSMGDGRKYWTKGYKI